jgi:hypothetical protein
MEQPDPSQGVYSSADLATETEVNSTPSFLPQQNTLSEFIKR